jgi:hypothetical protein
MTITKYKTKKLYNIKEHFGYIEYRNSGYRYFTYQYVSLKTNKLIRGQCLLSLDDTIYTHNGNGEADSRVAEWVAHDIFKWLDTDQILRHAIEQITGTDNIDHELIAKMHKLLGSNHDIH